MCNPRVGGSDRDDSIAVTLDLLRHPHRRAIARYLVHTQSESVTHDDLVEYIVADADDARADALRSHVATTLRHVHLPKLDAAGVIEYDPDDETVRVDLDRLRRRLDRVLTMVAELRDDETDSN